MKECKSIFQIIEDIRHESSPEIVALPLMCGSGKSTSISQVISAFIRRKEGILILTDRVARFQQYLEPIDKSVRSYIKSNENKIAVLSAKNFFMVTKEYINRPILMMTTQRFFRFSTQEKLKYMYFGNNKKRNLILVDEQPPLIFQARIDIDTLNSLEKYILQQLSNNTLSTYEEIYKYSYVRTHVLQNMYLAEKSAENSNNFYTVISPLNSYGESKYTFSIDNKSDVKCFDTLRGVHIFNTKSALYSYRSQRTGKYESYILPTVSEVENLKQLQTKIIILDGTCDLAIDYYNQPSLRIEDDVCKPYIRKLSNLTIILVKEFASKKKLIKQSVKRFKRFAQFIRNDSHCENVYVFSHKQIVDAQKNAEQQNETEKNLPLEERDSFIVYSDYFGNLKGRNDFRSFTTFGQVGLFTKPESYYLSRALELGLDGCPELIDSLAAMEIHQENMFLIEKFLKSNAYLEFKNKDILVDIEQNVFRSKIRDNDCTDKIRYYIFFDYDSHPHLKDLIIDRFKNRYGANVELIDPYELLFDKIRNRVPKGGKMTNSQKIIKFLDSLNIGQVFTLHDLKVTTGLKSSQINSTRQANPYLDSILKEWMIDRRKGIYKKKLMKHTVI